jgi:hypothetical protein
MKSLALRMTVVLVAPVLLIIGVALRAVLRRSPVHPVQSARGSASAARGSYQEFRDFIEEQKRYSRRSFGTELREDALSAILRGR